MPRKIFIFSAFLLFFLFLNLFSVHSIYTEDDNLNLHLFYSKECGNCIEVLEELKSY